MVSLVSILVIGAIYAVVYVVKSLRATPGDDGGRVFGESFPTIEVLENGQEYVYPVSPATQANPHQVAGGTAKDKCAVHTAGRGGAYDAPEKKGEGPDGQERLVKLSSKSEAKRAFLYSEIFARKY